MSDKLLNDFLKAQADSIKAPPKKVMKADNSILDPGIVKPMIVEDYSYIITKKPKPKKVMKYLQGMVNEIMADA
jgi:hypothetical protein